MQLKECQRIKLQRDFSRFREEGVFKNSKGFFCKIIKNPRNVLPRFAVIVGKKVGKAHERNAIKRLFREIFRQEQGRLEQKCDYLIVVRRGIISDFYHLKEKFLNMCAVDPKAFLSIAIDGPAASGKSSVARILGEKYHLLSVGTGDHYRALTFFLLKNDIKNTQQEAIMQEIQRYSFGTQLDGLQVRLTVNGICPKNDELRSEIVNKNVAIFAQISKIRQKLKIYQQNLVHLARKFSFAGVVMEGRDIGTHILPQADVKIFLTATEEIRANRRQMEGKKDAIGQRDALDGQYENNAAIIDTTHRSLEDVVKAIEKLIFQKAQKLPQNVLNV
jgi:cytidylate kinase/ribonuclease P protein component